jgi:PAS domain S-box-containing protein
MSPLQMPNSESTPLPDLPLSDLRPPGLGRGALAVTSSQILIEIACTINSVLDLDQLYWVIYEQCSRVFETDNFWIGRCTDGTTAEAVLWFYHGKQIVAPGETIPVGRGLNSEVLRTRRTLRVGNYAEATRDRGFPPESGPIPDDNHAWIGVPMLVGDRLIGLIVTSRPRSYNGDDARLLEAIAALCAVSIENAGLVQLVSETAQDLMRSTQELSDLNKVASAVNRSLDLPTVLAQGADMLLRVTGWDTATVCLRESHGQWDVALHRYAGATPRVSTPAWVLSVDSEIGHPSSALYPFVQQALSEGRPVAVDLAASAVHLHHYLACGLRRLVVFPLRAGRVSRTEEPPALGVLLLGSCTAATGKVTAEMLRDSTLLAIGEQLATAVQNARLLDAVQTARGHLAAVLESTADGVIFYADDLRVELANRAVHEYYGLAPGTMIGKTPEELSALVAEAFVDPAQPAMLVNHLRTAAAEATYVQEYVLQAPRRRVFQRVIHPVHDESGAVLGRLVVYHDITEAKDLERRTRELAALEERQHLARELHDSVTQSLFTVTLMAEAAQAMAERDPARVGPYLERLKGTAATALDEMRALLAQLRPSAVSTAGLGPALRRHAEIVTQQFALPIEVEVGAGIGPLPHAVEDALYRITQEALHNTVKHACATHAHVRLMATDAGAGSRDPGLLLTVEDDGRGFDPTQLISAGEGCGLGLTGMRERAAALGGHLTIDSTAGRGSRIVVAVPLPAAEG